MFSSNLSHISHHFGDIVTQTSEIAFFFAVLSTPVLFEALTGVFPWGLGYESWCPWRTTQ